MCECICVWVFVCVSEWVGVCLHVKNALIFECFLLV